MAQVATTQGFQGSDTDELDKVVTSMKQAADFADMIVKGLKILCAALDAMSWTGYAAALAKYLRATVIPIFQALSRNLRAFATVVGFASSLQKDTSTGKPIINAGDTGYTPSPIRAIAAPGATAPPAPPSVAVDQPATIGAVDKTPTPEALKTVVSDISELIKDIGEFQQIVQGDGPFAEKAAAALSKLAEIITDVQKLFTDPDSDGSPDTPAVPGNGQPGVGDPAVPGTTSPVTTPPGTAPPSGTDTTPPAGAGTQVTDPFDALRIWKQVNDVLVDLGLVPSGGTELPTTVDASPLPDSVSGHLDGIQTHLDGLREDLGIPAPAAPDTTVFRPLDTPVAAVAPISSSDRTFTADDSTPAFYDSGATSGLYSGSSPSTGASFAADAPSTTGSYTGADPSGGGSGSSGAGGSGAESGTGVGSGSGSTGSGSTDTGSTGTAETATATPAEQAPAPTWSANAAIPVGAPGADTAAGSDPQVRLVATTTPPATSGAAIPLSAGAVAASLLGGIFARRANQSDDDTEEAGSTATAT